MLISSTMNIPIKRDIIHWSQDDIAKVIEEERESKQDRPMSPIPELPKAESKILKINSRDSSYQPNFNQSPAHGTESSKQFSPKN